MVLASRAERDRAFQGYVRPWAVRPVSHSEFLGAAHFGFAFNARPVARLFRVCPSGCTGLLRSTTLAVPVRASLSVPSTSVVAGPARQIQHGSGNRGWPLERAGLPVARMTKPVTVLVVSNHGDIVGGGEISLLALLMSLDRSQWAPIVVVPNEGVVAKRCRQIGIVTHVIPLPGLRRPGLAMVRSVAKLRRLIRQTGSRLLHANGSRAMFYAGLAGRLGGQPVIWHVRVADHDGLLDRFLARLACRIIVCSRAVGHRFEDRKSTRLNSSHGYISYAVFCLKK